LNLELQSSANATTVAVAKMTGDMGWRVEKKCLCIKLLLVARHILTMGHQNAFKAGSVKFTITAFHCEESTPWK